MLLPLIVYYLLVINSKQQCSMMESSLSHCWYGFGWTLGASRVGDWKGLWISVIVNKRSRGMVKCLTPKMLAIASLSNCMYCFLVVVRVLLVNAIGSGPSFIWWLPCHKGMHHMPMPVACLHQSVQGGWKTLVLLPWSRILVVHVSTYMGFHLQEMMEWGQGS